MLKNIEPSVIANVIAKAVLEALNTLENPKIESKPAKSEGATLSPEEFRAALGEGSYGINQIHSFIRAGRIKHVKMGARKVRIPRSEIVDFIEREAQGGK